MIPPFFVRSVPCRLRGPDAIETEGARRKAFFRKHRRVLRARCPGFRKKRVSRGMFNRRYIEMLPRRSGELEGEKEKENRSRTRDITETIIAVQTCTEHFLEKAEARHER